VAQALDRDHHTGYPGPALQPGGRPRWSPTKTPVLSERVSTGGVAGWGDPRPASPKPRPGAEATLLHQQLGQVLYLVGSQGMLAEAEQILLGIN